MTLPQRNTALARPTNFYYLMCKLDRAQYQQKRKQMLRKFERQSLLDSLEGGD